MTVVTDIKYMLNSNGYASVVIHPAEFAQKVVTEFSELISDVQNGISVDSLNVTMLNELNLLLDYIQFNTSEFSRKFH